MHYRIYDKENNELLDKRYDTFEEALEAAQKRFAPGTCNITKCNDLVGIDELCY